MNMALSSTKRFVDEAGKRIDESAAIPAGSPRETKVEATEVEDAIVLWLRVRVEAGMLLQNL